MKSSIQIYFKTKYIKSFIISILVLINLGNSAFSKENINKYTVGINDILSIMVMGHEELTVTPVVAADGSISLPYLDNLHVQGMAISEIKEMISEKLAGSFVKYPIVSVSLVTSQSRRFYVYGEVKLPGQFVLDDKITVLKAISLAGGITPDGRYGNVKVRRKQSNSKSHKDIIVNHKDTSTVRLRMNGNMLIKPEDIVIVESNAKFFVYGKVEHPGEFILKDDITVLKAISLAGGIKAGGLFGTIKLRRKNNQKKDYKEMSIDLNDENINEANGNMLLMPEDILIIKPNAHFYIYGEVSRPGEFTLKDDITVFKAISLAGGITDNGLYGLIKLKRKQQDSNRCKEIIIDLKETNKEGINGDTLIKPDDVLSIEPNFKFYVYGEVSRPGGFSLEDNMTVLKAISYAGGFSEYGTPYKVKVLRTTPGQGRYKTIKFNFKRAMNGISEDDISIEANDVVIVSASLF